jgi:hypothetical protein
MVDGPHGQPEFVSLTHEEEVGVEKPERVAQAVPSQVDAKDRPDDGIDVVDPGPGDPHGAPPVR